MSLGDLIRSETRRIAPTDQILIGPASGIVGHVARPSHRRTASHIDWTPGSASASALVRSLGRLQAGTTVDVVIAAAPADWGPLMVEGSQSMLDEMLNVATAVIQQTAARSDARIWLCIELSPLGDPSIEIWRDLHTALLQRRTTASEQLHLSMVLTTDPIVGGAHLADLLNDEHRFGSLFHDLTDAGGGPPDRRTDDAETTHAPAALAATDPDATTEMDRRASGLIAGDDHVGDPSTPADTDNTVEARTAPPAVETGSEILNDAIGYIAARGVLEQVTNELRSARADLSNVETEIEHQQLELSELRSKKSQLTAEVTALQGRTESARRTIEHDIAQAAARLRDLTDQTDRAQKELDAVRCELEVFVGDDDQRHLTALRVSREHLIGELSRLSDARQMHQSELDRLRTEADRSLAETKQAEDRRAALLADYEQLHDELEHQRPALLEAVQQLEAVQGNLDSARLQRDELTEQLLALRHSMVAEHRAFNEYIEDQRRNFDAETATARDYLHETGRRLGAQRRALAWKRSQLDAEIKRCADERLNGLARLTRRERRRLRRLGPPRA